MSLFAWNIHGQFELMGERGVLQWRRLENQVRVFDSAANRWEVYPSGGQLNDMYLEEARHFLACIRGEATPRCDGWDGLRTMRVSGGPPLGRRAALGHGRRPVSGPYVFGVIPARGGSKGLPGKNLKRRARCR